MLVANAIAWPLHLRAIIIPATRVTWTTKKSSYCRFRINLDAVTPIVRRPKPTNTAAYCPGISKRNNESVFARPLMNIVEWSIMKTIVV